MSWLRKAILALVVLLFSLEFASRMMFGNYAQSALVERTVDPNLCMVLAPNQELTYTGWYRKVPATIMESDEHGSRGFIKDIKYQEDVKNIFMIGDSFTYGQGVNIADALPTLVNADLGDGVRVWNFGVPGRNFYQMPSEVQRLAAFNPDLILVNLFINDFHEPPGQCMLNASTDWKLPLMRHCHLCRWSILGVSSDSPVLSKSEMEKEVIRTIQELNQQSHELSIPIVFVLMMDHYAHRDFQPELPAIHSVVQSHASEWIDLEQVWTTLLMQEESYQIPGEFHWNPAGNQILAEAYSKSLRTHIPNLISQ